MNGRKASSVAIRAISSAAPERIVTQKYFELLYGAKEVERIAKGTGIRSIREGKSLKTSDLILAACQSMIENGALKIEDVDCVIVVTQTPDAWSPGTSFVIQHRLGLSKSCFVLDIIAGCAGYITALGQGSALIASGVCKKVLICTGDITTQLIDDEDRHLRMLFGDAASVTLLEEGSDTFDFIFGADGSGSKSLGSKIHYKSNLSCDSSHSIGNLHMDGTAVMNFALSTVPATVKEMCSISGLTIETLDLLVLHQANEFMINYLRRIIGIAPEKLPVDIDGLGNTSSTSIPFVLSRHPAVGTENTRKVILCGFGAGLSWGAVRVNLADTIAIPPVYVPCKT